MTTLEKIRALLAPLRCEGAVLVISQYGESSYTVVAEPDDDWSFKYSFKQFGGPPKSLLSSEEEKLASYLRELQAVAKKQPPKYTVGDRVRWTRVDRWAPEKNGSALCTVLGNAFGALRLLRDSDSKEFIGWEGQIEALSIVDQVGDLHRSLP